LTLKKIKNNGIINEGVKIIEKMMIKYRLGEPWCPGALVAKTNATKTQRHKVTPSKIKKMIE
jgi:hypothetical protein